MDGTSVRAGWALAWMLSAASFPSPPAICGCWRRSRTAALLRSCVLSLKQGAKVDATEPDGATALAWAAHRDNLETADLLVRAGADPNLANTYGVTPLTLACVNRSAAMVETLLRAGADPNLTQSTGETALMTCARTGHVEAVKSLLSHRGGTSMRRSGKGGRRR